jgi:hypothetical protein
MLTQLMNAISRLLYPNSFTMDPGSFESFILGIRSNELCGPMRRVRVRGLKA